MFNITRDVQIKTIMRCHRIPIRMATVQIKKKKKPRKQVLVMLWRKWNLYALLVGT